MPRNDFSLLHIISNRRKQPFIFWYVLYPALLQRRREGNWGARHCCKRLQNSNPKCWSRHPENGWRAHCIRCYRCMLAQRPRRAQGLGIRAWSLSTKSSSTKQKPILSAETQARVRRLPIPVHTFSCLALEVAGRVPSGVEKVARKLDHFHTGNIWLWRGRAGVVSRWNVNINWRSVPASFPFRFCITGNVFHSFSPSIKGIEKVPESACQKTFSLEEWKLEFITNRVRDGALALLKANFVLLAPVSSMSSGITSSRNPLAKEQTLPVTGLWQNSLFRILWLSPEDQKTKADEIRQGKIAFRPKNELKFGFGM